MRIFCTTKESRDCLLQTLFDLGYVYHKDNPTIGAANSTDVGEVERALPFKHHPHIHVYCDWMGSLSGYSTKYEGSFDATDELPAGAFEEANRNLGWRNEK